MPGRASGEVRLLRRKPLRSTVKGPPSSDKKNLQDARRRNASADARLPLAGGEAPDARK